MSLFGHGKSQEFLLFICNFNMTLAATGTLEMDAKIQYIHKLVRGEALRQFNLFSADVENIETLNLNYHIKSLALYFPPVNLFLIKARCAAELKTA